MNINVVCEKKEQADIIKDIAGTGMIYDRHNTMPYIFRNADAMDGEGYLDEPCLLIRNIDELGFLKSRGYNGEIRADHTMYTFNDAGVKTLKELGITKTTFPLELNYNEMCQRGGTDTELVVYGRVPMMISAGCVYRNVNGDKCDKDIKAGHVRILTDRMNKGFPVICECRHCYNIILNSVPLSLHKEKNKIKKLAPESLRLYFTVEDPYETRKITEYFIRLFEDDEEGDPPFYEYTKGHFIKGVE